MKRGARHYMYGASKCRTHPGHALDAASGKAVSLGNVGMMAPNLSACRRERRRRSTGWSSSSSYARHRGPAEMNFYLPSALCMAENATPDAA